MRILVIGGTRFIGKHIVDRLLSANHKITLFNRGKLTNPFDEQVNIFHGNRENIDDLKQLASSDNFDVVIDTIAYNKQNVSDIIEVFNGSIGHYIMISTLSAYREPLSIPIYESNKLERRSSLEYGFCKAEAERELFEAYAALKFPATILRLPAVYGEHDYQAREWYFIKRIIDKRERLLLPASGLSGVHREYVKNIAYQIQCIIENKHITIGQAYNSGHDYFLTTKALSKLFSEIMDWQYSLYTVTPNRMPWIIPLGHDDIMMASTKKLHSLGYVEKYNLYDGLKNTIDYYMKNPIKEWIINSRQQKNLFDYQLEDEIIDNYGSIIS